MYLHVVNVRQGYRAEMDNPALSGLLPPILRSKRDILFGNMPEIYNFHSRQAVNDLLVFGIAAARINALWLKICETILVYTILMTRSQNIKK